MCDLEAGNTGEVRLAREVRLDAVDGGGLEDRGGLLPLGDADAPCTVWYSGVQGTGRVGQADERFAVGDRVRPWGRSSCVLELEAQFRVIQAG